MEVRNSNAASQQEAAIHNEQKSITKVLPDELWANVFTLFNSIANIKAVRLSCKRFYKIATDEIILDRFPDPEYDYSLENPARMMLLKGTEYFGPIAVSQRNSLIAVNTKQPLRIQLCNMDGKSISMLPIPDNFRSYTSLNFSKDGQYLVAASTYRDVDVWSIKDNKLLYTISKDGHERQHEVFTLSNGNFLVLYDYYAEIFSLKTGIVTRLIQADKFNSCSISSDENLLVCWSGTKINIYDITTSQEIKKLKVDFPVYYAELSKDNENIIFCGGSNKVQIINLKTKNISTLIEVSGKTTVHSFQVSKNGRYIVIPEYDNRCVSIWDMINLKCINKISCGDYVNSALFNPTQDKIIIGYSGGALISAFPLLPLEKRIQNRKDKKKAAQLQNQAQISDEEQRKELFSRVLPSYLNLWENNTHDKFFKDVKRDFLNACLSYSFDYKMIKNTHHNVANLIERCLSRLESDKNEKIDNGVFRLFALKIILIGLHQYLDEKNTKKFIAEINRFEKKFPTLLSDRAMLMSTYGTLIDTVVEKYKAGYDARNEDDIFLLGSDMLNNLFTAYSEKLNLYKL